MILWHFQRQSAIKAPLTLTELAAPLKLLNIIPTGEKKTQEQLPVMGQQEHGIFSGAIQNFFTPQDPISLFLLPRHTKGLWDVLVPRAGIR